MAFLYGCMYSIISLIRLIRSFVVLFLSRKFDPFLSRKIKFDTSTVAPSAELRILFIMTMTQSISSKQGFLYLNLAHNLKIMLDLKQWLRHGGRPAPWTPLLLDVLRMCVTLRKIKICLPNYSSIIVWPQLLNFSKFSPRLIFF